MWSIPLGSNSIVHIYILKLIISYINDYTYVSKHLVHKNSRYISSARDRHRRIPVDTSRKASKITSLCNSWLALGLYAVFGGRFTMTTRRSLL